MEAYKAILCNVIFSSCLSRMSGNVFIYEEDFFASDFYLRRFSYVETGCNPGRIILSAHPSTDSIIKVYSPFTLRLILSEASFSTLPLASDSLRLASVVSLIFPIETDPPLFMP